MTTNGSDPCAFSLLALDKNLISALDDLGFETPTPVQQQAIPAILEGKDLLVSAETGSGKTAAYLLPALQRLIDASPLTGGVAVLVLCPTRELADQIHAQCRLLSKYTVFKTALITGGSDFKRQHYSLTDPNTIIVATPGRLLEHLEQDQDYFQDLSVLVLDEADRMLDMGFSDDVLNIIRHCNPDRQTLLFSATLNHPGVIHIAEKALDIDSVIALNTLKDAHGRIKQQMILADDHDHKLTILNWLLLNENYDKALVFANTRARAVELYEAIRASGLRAGLLHGDMAQKDRNRIMHLYRDGAVRVLAATDVAARGLDIKDITLVINFDMPRNGISYIHRIGRTGRADHEGTAIVLIKHTEWNLMSGIERFLNQHFERRSIQGLEGRFTGPRKTKTSGKAAGSKNKTAPEKKAPVKKVKIRDRNKKNIGKRRAPSDKKPAE